MTWVRREDTASIHRKVAPLDDATYRLWSEALEWCSRNTTDGRIAADELDTVSKRASTARAAKLVERVLWHTAADYRCDSPKCPPPGPDGWVIHDYLDYQPSKDRVRAEQEAKAERTRRWRERKGRDGPRDIDGDGRGDASHHPPQDGSWDAPVMLPRPAPPRPEGSGAGTPRAMPAASVLAARPASTTQNHAPGQKCRDCGNALTSAYHLGACLRATANGAAS